MNKYGNSENQWGGVSRFIHWLMTLLILGSLTAGFYMANLTDMKLKLTIMPIHKSLGVLFLGLLIFRFIWRQMNTIPTIPDMPFVTLSRLSAPILYLSMLSMPLSGILMSQASGYPVSFFGLFTLPTLISKSPKWGSFFNEAHKYSAFILIGLIVIHTFAALYHHYVLKDQIFERMLRNVKKG